MILGLARQDRAGGSDCVIRFIGIRLGGGLGTTGNEQADQKDDHAKAIEECNLLISHVRISLYFRCVQVDYGCRFDRS